MSDTAITPNETSRPTVSITALRIAAALSATAGLIHASAAGGHADDRTLAIMFSVAAALQFGWAALAVARPSRMVAIAGAAIGLGCLAVWALTRSTGIGFVHALSEVEPIAGQDLICAILGGAAGVAALASLHRPTRSSIAGGSIVTAVAALSLMAAVPAMAMPHKHVHSAGSEQADGHQHSDSHSDAAGETHAHGSSAAATGLAVAPGYDTATKAEKKKAQALVDTTKKEMARFTDTASVEAAGYHSIGDARSGFEHFVNADYLKNEASLDPTQPESIVFKVNDDGTKSIATAMYILPPGNTMANVPAVAGEMTKWHDHQNLCWDGAGRVAGIVVNGACTPGGTFRPTPPMLHVWVTDNECGPFSGIEGKFAAASHGTSCTHSHGG